eukprot:gene2464-3823_t
MANKDLAWESVSDDGEEVPKEKWGVDGQDEAEGGEGGEEEGEETEDDEEKYKRVDPNDGMEYCKREFVECYGGEAEWDTAVEVGKAPWQCSFCGVSDVNSVMQCASTKHWFCNGTAGTADTSHAVLHLILSGHKTLLPHPGSAMGGAKLLCHECEGSNLFLLGHLPHAHDPSATVLLCREPCLHTTESRLVNADTKAQWKPLIANKLLEAWLACLPRSPVHHTPRMVEIKQLEQAWHNGELDVTWQSASRARKRKQASTADIPTHFADGQHYKQVFTPFIRLEAHADRDLCDAQRLQKLDIKWRPQDPKTGSQAGLAGSFAFWKGDSQMSISRHDSLTVTCPTDPDWKQVFSVEAVNERTAAGESGQTVVIRESRRSAGPRGKKKPPAQGPPPP